MKDRGVFLATLALLLLQVVSQSSNVTSCQPLYQWTLNSKAQTPCLVAAFLESVCEGPVEVNSIPPNTHYIGPDLANATLCQCSTVTYSLISACGACQDRTFEPWTNWSTNCPQVEVGQYLQAIPTEVVVPAWAYLDVTMTNNSFNPILAEANQSSSSGTHPLAAPSSISTSGSHKSDAGAIAGGVVGGLVVSVALGLGILFWLRRRPHGADGSDGADHSAYIASMQDHPAQRSVASPMSISPFPYKEPFSKDPSETNPFPGSPVTSAIHTTFDAPSVTSGAQVLHRYTGSAEI
ncbi:hypothetical protein B0H10DRAFT_796535 [Mycena sp. CBHHK59/15]|nr:hypothetical protein B0H10DRAFT_796535 [Mycena sp. CBHHK59/15]